MEKITQTISTLEVEARVIELRGTKVILDRDVAELYQTETREINKALKTTRKNFLMDTISHCNTLKNSMWWKISTAWRASRNQPLSQKLSLKKDFTC